MTVESKASESRGSAGQSVQSVERAFTILETMADAGGVMGISQLSTTVGLPLPTIHRLTRTLVNLGYLHQDANRRYMLGPRLIRLGENSASVLTAFARPHLLGLVHDVGETANMARLDGDQIVYLAQVPSKHSMRMFTETGKRVAVHCTGVGKAILSTLPEAQVRDMVVRAGMPAMTERTITDPDRLIEHLALIRERGYSLDDGEQEVGVRCVAVVVPDAPAPLALSISGPASRITEDVVERAAARLREVAVAVSEDLR
jgi:IclR family acetate operon transcriptional repressor